MDLWKVKSKLILAHIYYSLARQKIADSSYTNIITTMEQLKTHEGHMGKLARLICKNHKFVSHIKRIAIDKAHTIYTAGIQVHNKPAHQPAYGYFNTIQQLCQHIFSRLYTALSSSSTGENHNCISYMPSRTLIVPSTIASLIVDTQRGN
jgi:hypothetical protein